MLRTRDVDISFLPQSNFLTSSPRAVLLHFVRHCADIFERSLLMTVVPVLRLLGSRIADQ